MELSEAESLRMQHRLSGRSENHKFIWVCGLFVWGDACMLSTLQVSPTPCDTMDYSPPGSSDHGILQARILERVAIPSYRESSLSRDRTQVS